MLAQPAAAATGFTRRDALRLAAASLALVAALSAILGVEVLPADGGLEVGRPAVANVLAPRAAEYESEVLTEAARERAREDVGFQYDYTPEQAAAIADEQAAAFARLAAPVDAAFRPVVPAAERRVLLEQAVPGLGDTERATLLALAPERWNVIRAAAARTLDGLLRAELRDTQVASVRDRLAGLVGGNLAADERGLAAALAAPLVVPNSSYSEELTEAARDQAALAVEPVVRSWAQGEVIVRAGDRVDAVAFEAIAAFGLDEGGVDLARVLGWITLSVLVVGLLLVWIWRFRPEFWHRNNVLLLLGLLLLFAAFALRLSGGRPWLPYVLPLAAVGMLVAVLLDASAAVVVTALVALVAGAVNGSVELAAYVLLGGLAGIVTVRRGDRLGLFVQAGLAAFAVHALVVAAFGLLGERDLRGVLELLGASAIASGGAAVAAVGSFAVLGSLFGIVTVFQLLELASPSQPLLRRLLVETPGTYHHSLMVGNLAERAASAIGADPLIARVAAYYHDIGKLANPAAFIENQAGGENVHDTLDPETSAQLLKAHVADGIDLAYRNRLPKALIAFIPQHHGTAVMSYFLARARENAAAPFGGLGTAEGGRAAEAVDVRRFRHAGPKPQSREAAIVMLADSVEASVRSLASRDEATIRAMVGRIIEERIADDQFDECSLTLRDIEAIREAFVGQLLGMYHQRVAYPQNKVVELESRRASGDR